jgi:hypothetical protein
MTSFSLETVLMLAYAVLLGLVALVLEVAARHAHRRSLETPNIGFTYHAERDVFRCPENQHLFPVFSHPAGPSTVYRAPASTCNACRSKHACTDSNEGREVHRHHPNLMQAGMQRFHRAFSITLLVLACLLLLVELFRAPGVRDKLLVAAVLTVFSVAISRFSRELREASAPSSQSL